MGKRALGLELFFDLPSILAFGVIISLLTLAANYFFSNENFLTNALITWATEGKISVEYYERIANKIDPNTLLFCVDIRGKAYIGDCKLDFTDLKNLQCKVDQIYEVKPVSNCKDIKIVLQNNKESTLGNEYNGLNSNIKVRINDKLYTPFYIDLLMLSGLAKDDERKISLVKEIARLYGYYIVSNAGQDINNLLNSEGFFALAKVSFCTKSNYLYIKVNNEVIDVLNTNGLEFNYNCQEFT